MPKKRKKRGLMVVDRVSVEETKGTFSHEINRVHKRKHEAKPRKSKWYLKQMQSDYVAMKEVIAQEWLRLMLPRHPKTRLVLGEKSEEHENKRDFFVLSKEVASFRNLKDIDADDLKDGINSNRYKGLGEVLVMGLWLNDNDMKVGNMGLDQDNCFVKIDGEQAFISLSAAYEDKKFNITSDVIYHLPFNKENEVFNWLDQISGYKIKFNLSSSDKNVNALNKSRLLTFNTIYGFNNNPIFTEEVNRTLFKIMVLPPTFIESFVHECTSDKLLAAHCITLLRQRQLEIRSAALALPSFHAYLNSEQAKKDFSEFLNSMSDFKYEGKKTIPSFEDVKQGMIGVANELDDLVSKIVLPSESSDTIMKTDNEHKNDRENNEVNLTSTQEDVSQMPTQVVEITKPDNKMQMIDTHNDQVFDLRTQINKESKPRSSNDGLFSSPKKSKKRLWHEVDEEASPVGQHKKIRPQQEEIKGEAQKKPQKKT